MMWSIASVRYKVVRHLFLLVATVSQLSLACEVSLTNGANAEVVAVPGGRTTLVFTVSLPDNKIYPIEQLWVSISNATVESSGIDLLDTYVPVISGMAEVIFETDASFPTGEFTVYSESAAQGQRTEQCWNYADILLVNCPIEATSSTPLVPGRSATLTWTTTSSALLLDTTITWGVYKDTPVFEWLVQKETTLNNGSVRWDVPTNAVDGDDYHFYLATNSGVHCESVADLRIGDPSADDAPTTLPSGAPSHNPAVSPSSAPSDAPTSLPSGAPSHNPTASPSSAPSDAPTNLPSGGPYLNPSGGPSISPSNIPSTAPPSTAIPSVGPSDQQQRPSGNPSRVPSDAPIAHPSGGPTSSRDPSPSPNIRPTSAISASASPSDRLLTIAPSENNSSLDLNGKPSASHPSGAKARIKSGHYYYYYLLSSSSTVILAALVILDAQFW